MTFTRRSVSLNHIYLIEVTEWVFQQGIYKRRHKNTVAGVSKQTYFTTRLALTEYEYKSVLEVQINLTGVLVDRVYDMYCLITQQGGSVRLTLQKASRGKGQGLLAGALISGRGP